MTPQSLAPQLEQALHAQSPWFSRTTGEVLDNNSLRLTPDDEERRGHLQAFQVQAGWHLQAAKGLELD